MIYRRNVTADRPLIMQSDVAVAEAAQRPGMLQRATNLLLHACRVSREIGAPVSTQDNGFFAASSTAEDEQQSFHSLLRLLSDRGHLLRYHPSLPSIIISPEGWVHAEKINEDRGSGIQAFVAMWFNPDMRAVFDGPISKAISDAGWSPFRIDRKEHNDKIDDQIIAEIRRSRFLVADFTGHRGGVYFEAGFAMGFGLPVIWTCRKSEMADIHFDNRQYNFIDWESDADLSGRLQNRIERTIGRGPLPSAVRAATTSR